MDVNCKSKSNKQCRIIVINIIFSDKLILQNIDFIIPVINNIHGIQPISSMNCNKSLCIYLIT